MTRTNLPAVAFFLATLLSTIKVDAQSIALETGTSAEREQLIEKYLSGRKLDPVEGVWVWDSNAYEVVIARNTTGIQSGYAYIGILSDVDNRRGTGRRRWETGEIKMLLKATAASIVFVGDYFMADKSREGVTFIMSSPNILEISVRGDPTLLVRTYPQNDEPTIPRASGAVTPATSSGTCFAISPNGALLTSHHVVDGAKGIQVTLSDGRQLPAFVETSAAATDLAVLRIVADGLPYLSIAAPGTARVGQTVFTVGYPVTSVLGEEPKFSEGPINALSGLRGDATFLQMSTPIQPGSSGAPLLTTTGEVVGVVTATAAVARFFSETGALPQNVNWAVKAEYSQLLYRTSAERQVASGREEAIEMALAAVCRAEVVR